MDLTTTTPDQVLKIISVAALREGTVVLAVVQEHLFYILSTCTGTSVLVCSWSGRYSPMLQYFAVFIYINTV